MSLYDIYQSSFQHVHHANTYPLCMVDDIIVDYAVSPLFSSNENSLDLSYPEPIFSHHEYRERSIHVDDELLHPYISPTDDFRMDLDEFDLIFNSDVNETSNPLSETLENGENHHSQSHQSTSSDGFDPGHAINGYDVAIDMTSIHEPSLVLPFVGMEIDNQLCLVHLFTEYAEAMEKHEIELSEVIARHIIRKVNPLGGIFERALYYMFRHLDRQSGYLIQECIKNFYQAFKALYQILPYGRFAHLVANSAILESWPKDVKIIHIIVFDIGEGIQLTSLMEAIKPLKNTEIRITSVCLAEEDDFLSPLIWRFEETKRRLCHHARSCGLKIKVEEVALQDLEFEMNKMMKKEDYYGRKSWYVFNCNVGLPHMGRVRSQKDVSEFLRVAKNFLHQVKGIITYCDGNAPFKNPTNSCSYSSFVNENFVHYRALLESMEFAFPDRLVEARTVLECLFVAPYISSVAWNRKWEEKMQYGIEHLQFENGLERWRFSEACLIEAKEMVKEGESMYGVRIGEQMNEIVMNWNGIPLVRVWCWKN